MNTDELVGDGDDLHNTTVTSSTGNKVFRPKFKLIPTSGEMHRYADTYID